MSRPLAALLGLLALTAPASGPSLRSPEGCRLRIDWRFAAVSGGVRIYHAELPGSPIPMMQARMVLDAPLRRVRAVVSDYDHFAEFIPNVAESKILREHAGTRWVYQHLSFPGPIADRYYVIRIIDDAGFPAPDSYCITWQLAKDQSAALARRGLIPKSFSGFWELRPDSNPQATDALYSVHIDPGGLVPRWLVVMATDRYLPEVVAAVRRRVEAPPR